jgi:hypothetical protein
VSSKWRWTLCGNLGNVKDARTVVHTLIGMKQCIEDSNRCKESSTEVRR